MKVVCFGDSITAGQYVKPAQAWPALLPAHLDVVVSAVCGETTRRALERFPRDVQESGADIVLIQYGLNDANRWETDRGLPRVSEGAYVENLAEMVERARAFSIYPVILGVTPTTVSAQRADDAYRYHRAAMQVAHLLAVTFCDIHAELSRGVVAPLLLPDGVHLSPEGHRAYAAAVSEDVAVLV